MNNLIDDLNIEKKIYEIRGKQVMLDSDLAILYHCANGTKTINQAVNRHRDRFPDDFYFQLTKDEYKDILRSQVGTLELGQGKHSKFLPFVFTEQGVAMLATVLRTSVAAEVSIKYNDSFHDRFIILDNKYLYHIGTSLNNAGIKIFLISRINNDMITSLLINYI